MDIRKILVPFDFSEYSEKACSWAVAMAEKWRARILLLHVVPRPTYPPVLIGTHFNAVDFEAGLQAEAEERMRAFVEKTEHGRVPIDVRVLIGEPSWDICKIAEEEAYDLVIMGSHGRTGLGHMLLGSVAERVVRLSPCPVLVVGKKAPV
ncbi:MAG: universal stress protein [Deltaproteobacteria bacterium]|nr:universal stress protein [Deltaproteobacteria bacterium]